MSWPSGQSQTFTDLAVDRKFTVTEPTTPVARPTGAKPPVAGQFTEVSQSGNLALASREVRIDESGQNPLLPMRQNRRGPGVAAGDVNGDGRDDLVLGGTPADPTRLVVADAAGHYAGVDAAVLASGNSLNDGPLLLFDADGDGSNDLLVTKGGVALPAGAAEYQPKLFLNDGHGAFRPAPAGALPVLPYSVGAVAAADFDHDGRLDLFLGGRVVPGLYPFAPKSALLANRGGRFEDVTDALAPGLREVGMVTSALWSDADGDGWPDLLVALEWGQVKYFHNKQGKGFEDWTEKWGLAGDPGCRAAAFADYNRSGRLSLLTSTGKLSC